MIRHSYRGITSSRALLCSLLATGAALLGTGCGGSSSSPNPQDQDTAVKVSDVGAPDKGAGGSTGSDVGIPGLGGSGGSIGVDAGTDVIISGQGGNGGTPLDSGRDSGSGGSTIEAGPVDMGKDIPSSPEVAVDAPPFVDVGSSEAESVDSGGPWQCPSATHAWTFGPLTEATSVGWASDGNLVLLSTAWKGVDFASKPWTYGGGADLLASKLDPKTGEVVWLFTAGDIKNQAVTGGALSSSGVGVLGYFQGTLDIDPVNQVIPPILNTGSTSVDYLVGLNDSDGTGVWSRKVDLKGGRLAVIAGNPTKDYFIVCGSAMNTAANLSAANLGTVVGTPGGGKDVIVAAVSTIDGKVKWAKLFGGDQDQMCLSAALDDSGNAVIAGNTAGGGLDFGTGAPLSATGSTSLIMWVARLDGATGTVAAAKAFSSANTVHPYGVALDSQGNAIVVGDFSAQVSFGARTLLPVSPTSDAFAVKLDTSLATVWARRWSDSKGTAVSRAAAVDSAGRVTVVGAFSSTADVGPGSAVLTSHSSAVANLDSFVVTLDGSNGQTLCAINYGDPAQDGGGALCVAINRSASGTNKDRAAIGGTISNSTIDFGGLTQPLSAQGTFTPGSNISYLLEM